MEFITRQPETLDVISRRLELVIKSSGVGVWDWNPQTDEVVFDKQWAAMLGLTPDELTQTLADWSDRVHPDDLQGCFDDINAHINGDTPFYHNTHRMRHKAGHWVYILDRGTIVERDDQGRPIRFTGTHTDVTSYVASEQRAKDALRARDLFFAQISHEIRTPVHAMLAAASLIDRRELGEKNLKFFEVVEQCADNLVHLIDDILDIARLSAGGIKPNLGMVNVAAIAQGIVDLFQPKAALSNISLVLENNLPERTTCRTDADRLTQIIHNLVSNGLKYTPQGFVKVKLDVVNEQCVISVQDSGIGIGNLEAAFADYSRETRLNDKGSAGLGLGIVRQLCELMAIDLQVETEVGRGTTFSLVLGGLANPSQSTIDIPPPSSSLTETGTLFKNALLVDDSPFNLFVGEHMLMPFFESVDAAESGEAAKTCLTTTPYDVLFLDLNMPDMDGIELARTIKTLGLPKQPWIICQTADATSKDMVMSQGVFDGFLIKPYAQQDILQCLAQRVEQVNS
jgi:PAS domain S-box-containing protein